MCLLIVIAGLDPDYPILCASNRDEHRDRAAAPPGLWVGRRHRALSPRDRRAGGTWIGVNDVGLFAGLTNLCGSTPRVDAPSRGVLPHLALDADDLDGAADAVAAAVSGGSYHGFQLCCCDGRRSVVLVHEEGTLTRQPVEDPVVVLSNEHRLGELELPGLGPALAPGLPVAVRLERLRSVLLDEGAASGHRILKTGGEYGTVSSSLIAVRPGDPRALIWRYAPGPPDRVAYRDYGNLGRRLCEG